MALGLQTFETISSHIKKNGFDVVLIINCWVPWQAESALVSNSDLSVFKLLISFPKKLWLIILEELTLKVGGKIKSNSLI